MLDHISLSVANLERAAAFDDGVLAALGYVRVWSFPDAVGYGRPGGGDKLALKARQSSPSSTRRCAKLNQ